MAETTKTRFGFTRPIFSQSSNSTKLRRIAENYIKTNTDEFGDVSDSNVYLEAINILLPGADDILVANKIADFRNAALKLESKIEDAENSLVLFREQAENDRSELVQRTFRGSVPSVFFGLLADFYSDRVAMFEDDIMAKNLKEVAKGDKISSSLLTELNDLRTKEFSLQGLSNTYVNPDPETGLLGPAEVDAWGVFVTTNPETGSIVDIRINPVVSDEDFPKGFTKTDRKRGRIPVYVNTFGFGEDRRARIGDMRFEVSESPIEGEKSIMKFEKGVGRGIVEALFVFGEAQRAADEISFEDMNFNSFDVPENNVVKDGRGNLYYYGDDRSMTRFEDLNSAKQYLLQIGKNPQDAEDVVFRVNQAFIGQTSTLNEDGTERFMTSESLGATTPVNVSTVAPSVPTGEQLERFIEAGKGRVTGSPVQVQPSREFVGGQYDPNKVLQKGRDIFTPLSVREVNGKLVMGR